MTDRIEIGAELLGQSLLDYVDETYGTDRVPEWRWLGLPQGNCSSLDEADVLVFLLKELLAGNWKAYESLALRHSLVAELAVELGTRTGVREEDFRKVARALVAKAIHVEPCLVGATILCHIGGREDVDLMSRLGAHPLFGGMLLHFVFRVFEDRSSARAYLESIRGTGPGIDLMIKHAEARGYI